jgi:hypothetical protein
LVMSLLQQFHHLVCKAIWAINHPHVAITFVSDQNCRITQIHSQTCPALLIFKWKKCGAWAFCTFCRTAKVDFFLNGKNYDKCTGTYTHTHTHEGTHFKTRVGQIWGWNSGIDRYEAETLVYELIRIEYQRTNHFCTTKAQT